MVEKKKLEDKEDKNRTGQEWVKSLGLFGTIVGDLVVFVGLGAWGGFFLKNNYDLGSWVIGVTVFIGFLISLYQIMRILKREDS